VAKFTVSPSRIARYYFHECDRHLRYASTPKERRAEEGVPARSAHQSAIGKAILDGGYRWEERILDDFLAGRVITGTDGEPGAPVPASGDRPPVQKQSISARESRSTRRALCVRVLRPTAGVLGSPRCRSVGARAAGSLLAMSPWRKPASQTGQLSLIALALARQLLSEDVDPHPEYLW
jgi:hypothetical protein